MNDIVSFVHPILIRPRPYADGDYSTSAGE